MGSHRKKSTKLDGDPGTISAHYLWGDPIPVFVGFLGGMAPRHETDGIGKCNKNRSLFNTFSREFWWALINRLGILSQGPIIFSTREIHSDSFHFFIYLT